MSVTSVEKDPDALTMTVTVDLDATVERAWQLWADPRQFERWWGPPGYPATVVDHDLRAGAHGYRRRYVPDSSIYHKVSQAMKTGSPISDYYYARNRLLFFRTHAPRRYRLWLVALYTARSLRYSYTLRKRGLRQNALAVARGIRDFYSARFGKCPYQFGPAASGDQA